MRQIQSLISKALTPTAMLLATAVLLSGSGSGVDAKKQWTIYERQVELTKRIASGEKANELTLKEADKLRKRMADINERVEKAKAKNGGKISYKDEGKIEKDLNKVSLDIQKLKLEKRVEPK